MADGAALGRAAIQATAMPPLGATATSGSNSATLSSDCEIAPSSLD